MRSSNSMECKIPEAHIENCSYYYFPDFLEFTTGIRLGPDVLGKLRSVMTVSTNVGVTGTLCSFRLLLERKAAKLLPESSELKLFEKISTNKFTLSDAERSTSGPLKRRCIPDLSLLKILVTIPQKS